MRAPRTPGKQLTGQGRGWLGTQQSVDCPALLTTGTGPGACPAQGPPGGAALRGCAEAAGGPALHGPATLGSTVAPALQPLWGLGTKVGWAFRVEGLGLVQ